MSEVSESTKQSVAELLVKNGLLKFGEFKLKSGIMSPFYIDLRQAQSYPELFHTITKAYCELIGALPEGVRVSGIPEAGTPLATAVGYELQAPLVQPRKVIKDHGMGKSIEGFFNDGDKIVVIDDLVTKGDSKLEALQQFKDNNLEVTDFYVLIDREQGGAAALAEQGLSLHSVMGITELIDRVTKSGAINSEQSKVITDFIKAN